MYSEFFYLSRRAERGEELKIALDLQDRYRDYPASLEALKNDLANLNKPEASEVAKLCYSHLQLTDSFINRSMLYNMKQENPEFNLPLFGDKYQLGQMYITIVNALKLVDVKDHYTNYADQLYVYALLECLHPHIEINFDPSAPLEAKDFKKLYNFVETEYDKCHNDLTLNQIDSVNELCGRFHKRGNMSGYYPVDSYLSGEQLKTSKKLEALYNPEDLKYSGNWTRKPFEPMFLDLKSLMLDFFNELTPEHQEFVMYASLSEQQTLVKPSVNMTTKYLVEQGLMDEIIAKSISNTTNAAITNSSIFNTK